MTRARNSSGTTPKKPASSDPNGFAALSIFDSPVLGGDGDGWISASDLVFGRLRLWNDENRDGISQPHELRPLGESGIRGIELEPVVSERRDRWGNILRWTGRIRDEKGLRLGTADVIFLGQT